MVFTAEQGKPVRHPRLAVSPVRVSLYVRQSQCERAENDSILYPAELLSAGTAPDVVAELQAIRRQSYSCCCLSGYPRPHLLRHRRPGYVFCVRKLQN